MSEPEQHHVDLIRFAIPRLSWSRRYVDVRAGHGRAAIQPEATTFKAAFLCFGIGVLLAASSMKDHWKRFFAFE